MITVGSAAAHYHGIINRKPNDIDTWVSAEEDYVKARGEGFDTKVIPDEVLSLIPTENGYATPNALYTIKMSHLGWDNPMWNKHKNDILCMKHKGCTLIEDLYQNLTKFWKTELGEKDFLSLAQSKEDFFTDNVLYKYDHDMLHEKAAYPNKPVYTKCLKENEQVLIDKSKFERLPFEDQVRMFKEEISVICFERWVIPHGISWQESYAWSVRKTITSLTKGWATDFLVRNLSTFVRPDKEVIKNLTNFINKEKEKHNMSTKTDLSVFEEMYVEMAEHNMDRSQFFHELFSGDLDELGIDYDSNLSWSVMRKQQEETLESYEYEHIKSKGGGEGEGEYCYGVIKFKDKYYKAEWTYYSYHGCEYSGIEATIVEVLPKQKTITVYE